MLFGKSFMYVSGLHDHFDIQRQGIFFQGHSFFQFIFWKKKTQTGSNLKCIFPLQIECFFLKPIQNKMVLITATRP